MAKFFFFFCQKDNVYIYIYIQYLVGELFTFWVYYTLPLNLYRVFHIAPLYLKSSNVHLLYDSVSYNERKTHVLNT